MEVASKPLDLLKKYEETFFPKDSVEYVDKDIPLLNTKKLILNEQIDRIVNSTLRELYKPPQTTHQTKPCKQFVDSKTLEILGTVPAPKNSFCVIQSKLNKNLKRKQQLATKSLLKKIDEIKNKHELIIAEKRLLRKYFQVWKSKLKKRRVDDDEKFKQFFENLKKSKQKNIYKIKENSSNIKKGQSMDNFFGDEKIKSADEDFSKNGRENLKNHNWQKCENKSKEELTKIPEENAENQSLYRTRRNKSVGDLTENAKEQSLDKTSRNKSAEYLRNAHDSHESRSFRNQNKDITFSKNQNGFIRNESNTNEFSKPENKNMNEFSKDQKEETQSGFNKDESGDIRTKLKENQLQINLNGNLEYSIKHKNSKQIINESFENRYKAQQDIIAQQKLKLLEQERVIEEIKHGKICEELDLSIKESRLELEEILRKCSLKTKLKIGAPNVQENAKIEEYFCDNQNQENLTSIDVKVNKAPKIVQKMEKRAQERAQKRELIKQRKKLIDEEKKRLAEELVESKRKQDEEERKKNLEAIKERRKRELEMEKTRRENKERFLLNCAKADRFYKRVLLRRGLKGFKMIREIGEEHFYKAEIFREIKLERKCFYAWRKFIEDVKEEKLRKAKAFYKRMLLRKCFDLLAKNRNVAMKNYQVALDYYDLRLQYRVFQWLLTYTCKERMRRYQLHIKADRHYNYRILVTYFYQWKSLKAVLVLEKAKEEKKKKWREKVLQILPDYRPPIFDV